MADDGSIILLQQELEFERAKKIGLGYDIYQIARRIQMLRLRGVHEPISREEVQELMHALTSERAYSRMLLSRPPFVRIDLVRERCMPHPGYMILRIMMLLHFLIPLCDIRFADEDFSAILDARNMYAENFSAILDTRMYKENNILALNSMREALQLLCTGEEIRRLERY